MKRAKTLDKDRAKALKARAVKQQLEAPGKDGKDAIIRQQVFSNQIRLAVELMKADSQA
jgi:hypothetical protein